MITYECTAQINMSYSLGSIAGTMKSNTYSNSFLINGQNCLNVSNSISKFWTAKKGDFDITCKVEIDFVNFGFTLTPNPVVNFTTIKLLTKIPNETQFRVTVFSSIGQLMFSKDVIQDDLLFGYRLDMSTLVTGYYYVQVASPKVLRSYKIFKN